MHLNHTTIYLSIRNSRLAFKYNIISARLLLSHKKLHTLSNNSTHSLPTSFIHHHLCKAHPSLIPLGHPHLLKQSTCLSMDGEPTTCRIRVKWPRHELPDRHDLRHLSEINGSPPLTKEIRQKWAEGVINLFSTDPNAPTSATIRPWDILLHPDGSVETLTSESGGRDSYPPRFRIPPQTVLGLDEGEKVNRAEKFALGSLLYELVTATVPFEALSDDEVQDHYSRGIFPDDVFAMPEGPDILGCWSLEFEKEVVKLSK